MNRSVKTVSARSTKKTTRGTRARPRASGKGIMQRCKASSTGTPLVVLPNFCSESNVHGGTSSAQSATRRRVSAEERHRMICEAAYFIAEREHFRPDPTWCWLQAETEVDRSVAVR